MLRFRVMFAVLLVGACAPSAAEVPATGAPPGTEVVAYAEPAPLHLALPSTTTTTVPPTTTTAPPPPPTTTTAPPVATTQPTATVAADPAPVGGMHPAVAAAFGTGDLGVQAMNVATCESGDGENWGSVDPGASSSTNDHGLFQIHAGSPGFPGGWVATFERVTGVPFWNGVYDAELNARFARWLYDDSGGSWRHWTCRHAA